jgi:hypothetical protein
VNSIFARVVSKCVFDGTTWPGLHTTVNRMRSAALPWCAGMMWRKPVRSDTTRCKRKKLSLPAYDSSPRISAAHCSVDMALVPESVSRSMRMLRAWMRKRLYPACLQVAFPLLARGVAQRLHALDAKRFDDGFQEFLPQCRV